jgi:lipopolysaccharide transport system ATP-binding protein
MSLVLSIENISKQYRLGQLGTGTISHDLNRFWARVRGKEDPYLKVGDVNDRSKAGASDYVWSLRDINFTVNKGDVVGIIGKNGAGKSTLLKILSQVTTPTTGRVKVKGRIAALLEVGTGFHPELTGRENIFLNGAILGMTKLEIKSKLDEIVDFSGVAKYLDTPVKRYSSGMMVRLGFAVAAYLEPEILIVDEVLAVGDAEFQEKCLGKMKDVSGQGRTVLFVSHNMASIKALCNRGILLNNGMVQMDDSVSNVLSSYQGMVKFESVVYPARDLKPVYKVNAWINKLWLEDKKGELNNVFITGSELLINAEYDSAFNSDIQGFCVAFAVTSLTGENIGDLANIFVEGRQNIYAPRGVVTCRIPRIMLNEGHYKLNVYISIKGVDQYWVKDVIGFSIEKADIFGTGYMPSSKDGFLVIEQEWTRREMYVRNSGDL